MSISWRDAIIRVLNEAQGPLHYSEISEQILSRGYYKTDGATPAATVNAQISASIKHDGDKSPFVRVDKGTFGLRTKDVSLSSVILPGNQSARESIQELESEEAEAIIRSFGMYWQRDLVVWRSDPKMFGRQQPLSRPVDFARQKGIYILYDHHTVVYVGRAIDRPLGRRLYEHTIDRLGSRWNRFSWFGLLDVTNEGGLREAPLNASLATVVATFEALLIETLEPPQNRKRGDDFYAVEYIQDVDPELREREIQNTLRTIEQKLRGGS